MGNKFKLETQSEKQKIGLPFQAEGLESGAFLPSSWILSPVEINADKKKPMGGVEESHLN